jgi:hypothetical protein
MSKKIAIGYLSSRGTISSNITELPIIAKNISINITADKNSLLRSFMHTEFAFSDGIHKADYFILYNTKSELKQLSYDEIINLSKKYVNAIEETGIQYFTGYLESKYIIDYGNTQINVSHGEEQKVILEVLSRKAVESVGYLDVRFQDTLCSMDYAIRLGGTKYYPSRTFKAQPWLIDIVQGDSKIAKQVIDTHMAGWYKYKHESLPWEQQGGNLVNLKKELKEIKNDTK